ncbi:MAG: hypothetical protein IT479_15155 [Xanthomonadales bacterium]|nr:hypothetical protein [Xanthomonadales bacterium]MCC6594598.1 hypothetical protein [Xanthomonadales bacterium]
MSFLDRLKREADQQRQQAEQTAREREQRELLYRSQIEPRAKALLHYLEGLVATLIEVRPPILVKMAIQGYGELCATPFWDYKLDHERRHRGFQISMTWSMKVDPERTPEVRAEGVTRVKALTSIFRQYHLGGIKEEKRTPQHEVSRALFHARGYIKARFSAQISADDPVLRLVFDNASWLGSSRRQVAWEQIDDTLFDRLARFIVREDDSLFTEELPNELRQRLRGEPAAVGTSSAPPSSAATQAPPQEAPPQEAPSREATPVVAATSPEPALRQRDEPLLPAMDTNLVPGVIPAPAPVTEGHVIEIDESKLGLDQWQESAEDGFGAFSFGADKRAAMLAPATTPAPTSVPAAAPTPATDPPMPKAPASNQVVAGAPPARAPAPAAAAPAASSGGDAPAQPGTPKAPADEASEREAALFRLKVRAMLARMRAEPGKDEG